MTNQPEEAAFLRWVTHVFDHRVSKNEWYWKHDAPTHPAENKHELGAAYMTRLFENPVVHLQPYTDAQINQGLWYLAHNACSNYMFAITTQEVALESRIQLVNSFYLLYEKLFAPTCSNHLGYLTRTKEDTARANPLNLICYMWWDAIPFSARPKNYTYAIRPFEPRLDEMALSVMVRTLKLNSTPCREGALHGLSHWFHAYPTQIQRIINTFLDDNPDLDEDLYNYVPGISRNK